ncbi:MAG: hypothetical protein KA758_02815 [Acidimicrobiales bacterium]|nr:hypothetical protein [Acidimicrobiales bacterium]
MAAHPSITPEDVQKRAKWVYEYLSGLKLEHSCSTGVHDGVNWLPFHPSNWQTADIPEPDKRYGWTSPIAPRDGVHAGDVIVRFCPKIIAEATLTMPFQPDNRTRFRRSKSDQKVDQSDADAERTAAISSLWFADNYVKAIGRILAEELAIFSRLPQEVVDPETLDVDWSTTRVRAEDYLYDQCPAALALVSEIQLQALGPSGR